jgi:hypothetical protein
MAAQDLTTLADVKAWLRLPAGTFADDALLTRAITSISALLQSTLNRVFAQATYTELRSGRGTVGMMTHDYPLLSVSSVKVDNIAVPPAADCTKPGYQFTATGIYLNGYMFTKGIKNVTLVYSAGYATVPAEIGQVCIDLISRKYKQRDRIGLKSEVLQNQTILFDTSDLTDEIMSVLKQHNKVVPIG